MKTDFVLPLPGENGFSQLCELLVNSRLENRVDALCDVSVKSIPIVSKGDALSKKALRLIQINADAAVDHTIKNDRRTKEETPMSESPQSLNLDGRNTFTSIRRMRDWACLTLESWRERSQLRRELDELDQRGELGRTLQDTGMTWSDVSRLMRAHPHTQQQLTQMMQHLGINRSALLSEPGKVEALRAMEWQCGECKNWRKCRAWLASAHGPESYRVFCPNAAALDDLRCSEAAGSSASTRERGVLVELRSEEGIEIAHA